MDPRLASAHITGYERVAAWSDLLDRINVFPVADADTGRNLKVTLAPIRTLGPHPGPVIHRLRSAATGNSGNIAAAFFADFLAAETTAALPDAVRRGRDHAWRIIADPQPGTMLSLLDALAEGLGTDPRGLAGPSNGALIETLAKAVHRTMDQLPALARAGVVDAGALALFIYLEGFQGQMTGHAATLPDPVARFGERLTAAPPDRNADTDGFCIDAVVTPAADADAVMAAVTAHGDSIVADTVSQRVKVHLHARDRDAVRRALESVGTVDQWQDSALAAEKIVPSAAEGLAVHVATDAAGSLTRADADRLGMTLLDSYLMVDDQVVPETHFSPDALYAAMQAGRPVSTAQASVFERHQCYQSLLRRHRRVIYLCVGSAFTGNVDAARSWLADNDPEGRMTVVDTGAASGRLALIALATARAVRRGASFEAALQFAESACAQCEEFVFLEQLKYLARGGRISKSKGFVGDLLGMKPIISPRASGAEKVGVVRNHRQQLAFALDGLAARATPATTPLVLLQYSDNRRWVADTVRPQIKAAAPGAEILTGPLSLTSGAHMGPGTWAMAFLPGAGASPEAP